jgi:hypothetical protein
LPEEQEVGVQICLVEVVRCRFGCLDSSIPGPYRYRRATEKACQVLPRWPKGGPVTGIGMVWIHRMADPHVIASLKNGLMSWRCTVSYCTVLSRCPDNVQSPELGVVPLFIQNLSKRRRNVDKAI